jgi:methionyl-tRNA formyltransferase
MTDFNIGDKVSFGIRKYWGGKGRPAIPRYTGEIVAMPSNKKIMWISSPAYSPKPLFFTQRKNGDEVIDWNKTSREIFNFIRALTIPGPCASTYHGQIEIKILEAQFMTSAPAYKGINGVIINVQHGAFFVKTSDSFIRVVKWNEEFIPRIGIRLK